MTWEIILLILYGASSAGIGAAIAGYIYGRMLNKLIGITKDGQEATSKLVSSITGLIDSEIKTAKQIEELTKTLNKEEVKKEEQSKSEDG